MAAVWKNPNALLSDRDRAGQDRHWRLIQTIASQVEGGSVLDVGCGMGHLLALVRTTHAYQGLDSSEAMIATAKSFFPSDAARFRIGSAYDLSGYGEHETVAASGLILHLPDPEPVLREMWNKAKVCLVFSAWVGKTPLLWRGRQPLYKRLLGIRPPKSGYIIQRRDTVTGLLTIVRRLDEVADVTAFPFDNPCEGESNYIFKVTRKR